MTARKSGLPVKRLPDQVRGVVAFLRESAPRRPLSGWSLAADVVVAAAATAAVIAEVTLRTRSLDLPSNTIFTPATIEMAGVRKVIGYAALSNGQVIGILKNLPQNLPALPRPSVAVTLGIALTAAPLAVRRRYPVAAFAVIVGAIIATRGWIPPVTFATAVFAAYCAVVYSRFRQLALLTVLAGAIIVTTTFPNTMPRVTERYTAILVVIPTVAVGIGMREWRRRAGDSAERLRRARAEYEAATRRAVGLERARIASELHDVVTHNVSVMVVQTGAARQVLAISPDQAREALLAVEASGRTAMAELRHLLGLLCPSGEEAGPGEASAGAAALHPQPGLGQLSALLGRVSAAGLPVELSTTGTPRGLPPGLDLAAYRVVQEALTNVIRHAGPASASVRLDYRPGQLVIDVTDDGRGSGRSGPGGSGASGVPAGPGAGRGLIGLRERIALYGGDLDANPRPGGGWRVRARIPFYPTRASGPDDVPATADVPTAAT
jgi:signal transduction histidine kinase